MPRVDIGGHELWYEEQGSGPPVLLVHALFYDRTIFDAQAKALSDRYRTIQVDVRGHGLSECPDGRWTLWEAGEDIVGLLDKLDVGPVHWVGLSMGGMIGMRMALDHPGRLASLCLVDTNAEAEARRKLHKSMAWTVRVLGKPAVRMLMPYVAGQMFSEDFRRSPAVEPWLDKVRDLDPETTFLSAMSVFDRDDLVDRLHEIHVPTMVLFGEQDKATPPSKAKVMAEHIPGARLANIPGAGHLSSVEQPDRVNRLVGAFLDQVELEHETG